MTTEFTDAGGNPSASSWERLLIDNWEQRPALFDQRRVLIEDSCIFDYLCDVGARWDIERSGLTKPYFATEHGQTAISAASFPRVGDSSFQAYLSRVSARYRTRSILLYVRNARLGSKSLREEVERLLAPAWASGLRWKRMEVELYVGRYDWTSIGIHREACANVHHVVRGEKEMLTWPPAALSPRAERPECAEKGSASEAADAGILEHQDIVRTTAAAGQAIYFPSGHWHVGVSRQLSVAVNFALYGPR